MPPLGSYQVSPEQALTNAGRLMKETLADAVKLEGGKDVVEQIRAITAAGIPSLGLHLGQCSNCIFHLDPPFNSSSMGV